MTDIDAMALQMPRFKRIADKMEAMLADPFVAGSAAERADALEDLKDLRAFRDNELPTVRERMGALDGLIKDVADLKNRPTFDPATLPDAPAPTPAADTSSESVKATLADHESRIAAIFDSVVTVSARIDALEETLSATTAKIDALMNALDVEQPDLGTTTTTVAPVADTAPAASTDALQPDPTPVANITATDPETGADVPVEVKPTDSTGVLQDPS